MFLRDHRGDAINLDRSQSYDRADPNFYFWIKLRITNLCDFNGLRDRRPDFPNATVKFYKLGITKFNRNHIHTTRKSIYAI